MWSIRKSTVVCVILLVLACVSAAPTNNKEKKCNCKNLSSSPTEQSCLLGHMMEILNELIQNQKKPICLKNTKTATMSEEETDESYSSTAETDDDESSSTYSTSGSDYSSNSSTSDYDDDEENEDNFHKHSTKIPNSDHLLCENTTVLNEEITTLAQNIETTTVPIPEITIENNITTITSTEKIPLIIKPAWNHGNSGGGIEYNNSNTPLPVSTTENTTTNATTTTESSSSANKTTITYGSSTETAETASYSYETSSSTEASSTTTEVYSTTTEATYTVDESSTIPCSEEIIEPAECSDEEAEEDSNETDEKSDAVLTSTQQSHIHVSTQPSSGAEVITTTELPRSTSKSSSSEAEHIIIGMNNNGEGKGPSAGIVVETTTSSASTANNNNNNNNCICKEPSESEVMFIPVVQMQKNLTALSPTQLTDYIKKIFKCTC